MRNKCTKYIEWGRNMSAWEISVPIALNGAESCCKGNKCTNGIEWSRDMSVWEISVPMAWNGAETCLYGK